MVTEAALIVLVFFALVLGTGVLLVFGMLGLTVWIAHAIAKVIRMSEKKKVTVVDVPWRAHCVPRIEGRLLDESLTQEQRELLLRRLKIMQEAMERRALYGGSLYG